MTLDPAFQERLAALEAVITDVDGVLTDARIGVTSDGADIRFFHMRDGMGTKLLQQAGLQVAWLSAGRDTGAIRSRAEMLDVVAVDVGHGDKGPRFEALCRSLGVAPDRTAYLGDDVNDLPAMALAGLTACPHDAAAQVRDAVDLVLATPGGSGAFREFAEMVIAARSA
jgi:3-deoxy-D-manno-octulosonate 8-phosphate phosphatase (KDO 8-P phosphatase)